MKHRLLWPLLAATCLPLCAAGDRDWPRHFREENRALRGEASEIRQQLHRIPELCHCETKTAAWVASYLSRLGLEVTSGIAGTGVKAVLRGGKPGPVIGLRADMDALPIEESTGLSFSSQHPGAMHACGHDMHMTHVLVAARMFAAIKAELPGTIVFLFH